LDRSEEPKNTEENLLSTTSNPNSEDFEPLPLEPSLIDFTSGKNIYNYNTLDENFFNESDGFNTIRFIGVTKTR